MTWNWIDIVLLLVILASVIAGVIKGFAWQVVRLLFLFFGILLAKAYAEPLGIQLRPLLGSHARPPSDRYVGYAVIFLVVYISSLGIAFAVRTAIEKMKLSSFDRLLGGIFGLLKGLLFGYALFLFVAVAWADDPHLSRSLQECQSSRFIAGFDSIIYPLFPDDFHDQIARWQRPSKRNPSDVRIDWRGDPGLPK